MKDSKRGELGRQLENLPSVVVALTRLTIGSEPPTGHYKVENIYVDKNTGKLIVEYDNTPSP